MIQGLTFLYFRKLALATLVVGTGSIYMQSQIGDFLLGSDRNHILML